MAVSILNVRIDQCSRAEAIDKASRFLNSPGQHRIFTPNPEMLIAAHYDPDFRAVLNRGDLNLCDGKGIQLLSSGKLERITGVDFMIALCRLAAETKKTVYFLGSGDVETLKQLVGNLQRKFFSLKIAGYHPGPMIRESKKEGKTVTDLDEKENNDILGEIALASPDILFVAFGHSKQEKWIDRYLPDLPSVKIAMGVGGAFDYLSGKITRAPRLLQTIGLEWLWRLFQEPMRIKRIIRATIVFPFLYLTRSKS